MRGHAPHARAPHPLRQPHAHDKLLGEEPARARARARARADRRPLRRARDRRGDAGHLGPRLPARTRGACPRDPGRAGAGPVGRGRRVVGRRDPGGPIRLRRVPPGEARPATEPTEGAPRARDDGRALRVALPYPGDARGGRPGLRRSRVHRGAGADEAVRGGRERHAGGAHRAAQARPGPRRVRARAPGRLSVSPARRILRRVMSVPKALTIAGSDSGGGAGIQADLKTFSAFRVFGVSVLTAVTARNSVGVQGVFNLPPEFVGRQLDSVLSDFGADAVKIGMLSTASIIAEVAGRLRALAQGHVVLDPVMIAKSGDSLLEPDARAALVKEMLPLATVVTPNLHEAGALAGMAVATEPDMEEAARRILALGPRSSSAPSPGCTSASRSSTGWRAP